MDDWDYAAEDARIEAWNRDEQQFEEDKDLYGLEYINGSGRMDARSAAECGQCDVHVLRADTGRSVGASTEAVVRD